MRSSPPPDSGFARSRSRRAAIAGPSPALLFTLLFAALPFGGAAALDSDRAKSIETGGARQTALAEVLLRAGAYIDNLHKQLSGIVAEETYVQSHANRERATVRSERTLKSDLLLVRMPPIDRYIMFRDVFEVDGTPIRDREDRLTRLFLQPTANARERLQEVISESARYNLGKTSRTVNTPLVGLVFLEPRMQPRMEYRHVKYEQPRVPANPAARAMKLETFTVPAGTWVIEFKETGRPTFIRTAAQRDFPATGRFWVDPLTGEVLVSQLAMKNSTIEATIVVSYQSEPLLGYRVPIAMDERYRARSELIDALATYGRFRQFQVTTSMTLDKPPGQKQ